MSHQNDLAHMTERLRHWAPALVAPSAEVASVQRLPGHSSITIACDVRHAGGVERLVLRVVPAGVPRSGSTDVLRQVPLLRLMEAEKVPVPRVRWCGEDPSWFGVEYLIVDRVAGATLGDLFEAGGAPRPAGDPERLFGQALDALAAIHGADWRQTLNGWDEPVGLDREIDRWLPLLRKAADPSGVDRGDWLAAGLRVRERLQATRPAEPVPGVVHGDFYSNNWMFDGERLSAVLDWETAVIGAQELDLGWLCMMYDPAGWSPDRRPDLAWTPSPDFLIDGYRERTGRDVRDIAWYRALAGYRLAALTAHYLSLHVTGRRVDDVWPGMGESVPAMLCRAEALLA